jgi:uncharacterized membrane protein
MLKTVGRLVLGLFLIFASIGHFISADEFLAQVPPWMPAPELVVLVSGIVELLLGIALIFFPRKWRPIVGCVTAAFFVIIFPGNLWQYFEARDAFGLDSDTARLIRLLLQPVLVLWALWATGAFTAWRKKPAPNAPVAR